MTSLAGEAVSAPISADAAAARADDLHRRYGRDVLDYCVRHLRSREEGEDAAQTVFLNAQRSLAKGTEPQYEGAWLFAIAEHVVSHRRRTNSRRLSFEVPVDADDLAYLAVAPSLEDAPDLTGFVDALSEMPALQRRALVLRELRGFTYKEVASELGVSGTVVETLLTRGRRRLADRMQDVRRTGKRALGLCLPWPSLQSFFGSGVAVKSLATVASVAMVTAALPLHQAVTKAPARATTPSRDRTAAASPRTASVVRLSSRSLAPIHAGSRATHKRMSGKASAARRSPSPVIPIDTPAPAAPTATLPPPGAEAGVTQSQPPTQSQPAMNAVVFAPAGDASGAASDPTGPPGQLKRSLESDPTAPPPNGPPPGHGTAADHSAAGS
jgi:RNA polymerase sigma-70 factor, ECF subfamily